MKRFYKPIKPYKGFFRCIKLAILLQNLSMFRFAKIVTRIADLL